MLETEFFSWQVVHPTFPIGGFSWTYQTLYELKTIHIEFSSYSQSGVRQLETNARNSLISQKNQETLNSKINGRIHHEGFLNVGKWKNIPKHWKIRRKF